MFAWIAALLLAIALILHLVGHVPSLVTSFWLGGLIAIAVHLGLTLPWTYRRPPPP